MDLKDRIKTYTKIDKTQRVRNVKWSPVPKNTNQTPRYSNQSLPFFLEMEKSLHDPSERKEYESKNDEEEEEFQFVEIREKLREAGTGWDVQRGVTKRYRDSQIQYAEVSADTSSESNASFTTARTTTTSLSEDSFSSAVQDFQNLEISEKEEESTKSEVVNCSSVDKVRYKRNALITGIIHLREKNCLVAENASVCLTPDKLTEKENLTKNKRKAGRYENQTRKFQSKKNTAKSRQPLKDLVQKNAKKKDNLVPKKVGGTDVDRDYFMNLSDERFTEFVSKKSKNSRKVLA